MNKIELRAAPLRRAFGLGCLWGLSFLLILVVAQGGMALFPMCVLLSIAAVAFWVGVRMYRATARAVFLTERGLETDAGDVIAPMDDILRVDRGAFAFKPSNGFLLTMKTTSTRLWAPGLYWRRGRRVGVGGVTPAAPAKTMAEVIAMRVASRNMDE